MNLKELTIKQAHELLEKREVSSVELTKEFLKNIKEKDPDIHAFLSVTEDEAIKMAKKVDDRMAKGEPVEMLAGISVAVKDNILIRGGKATAASKILENYVAPYDATVVKNLKEGEIYVIQGTLEHWFMNDDKVSFSFDPKQVK